MRAVGYGLDENNLFGTRHSRDGVDVAKVGTSQFRPVGDDVPARSFTSVGDGLCIGDSGGPALTDRGAVAGVYSKVVGTCTAATAVDTFTEVAPFVNDLILPAFQAAGYEPWLEGNSEPGLYGTGGSNGTGGDSSTGGDTGASGGSTSTAAGGAPIGTGGDTSGPDVFDQAAPRGGSCACRAATNRRTGLGALLATAAMLGLRRRKTRY